MGFYEWEKYLRAAAKADNYALFRDYLRRLGLPEKPKLMLKGTILVVQASAAYASIDGQKFTPSLEMQRYNPTEASEARYAFTFDLCGKSFARVLVNAKMEGFDLADLYNHPWKDYKAVGYHRIWISHPDWSVMTREELEHIEKLVTEDLRFDYSEDELNFWFYPSEDRTYLLVTVQDVYESVNEDELSGDG
jgi:hypothetical protein